MANPNVNISIRDQGLGIIPAGSGGMFAKIGPSPLGIPNSVVSVADNDTLRKSLGSGGPLVEASAIAFSAGAQGSVRPSGLLLVPVNPSTYGVATAVIHSGPGTGTITVTIRPSTSFLIRAVLGGAVGVATFQTSVDGGSTWGPVWTSAATVQIPGVPFTTLAFGTGAAVSGDTIQISTITGAGTLTSGTGTLAVTHSSSSPVDAYSVVITITSTGGAGVGMFTYSLDGGNTVSAPQMIPGSGTYPIPDGLDPNKTGNNQTGVVLTFAGAFTAPDTYTFNTTSASYSTTDMTNAINALTADARLGSSVGVHVVGPAATSAASATLAAALETLMVAATTSNYKFNRAMIEAPLDTDAALLAAFANVSAVHVAVASGWESQVSPLNGRIMSRPSAWQAMARAGSIAPAEALGLVVRGSLPGVVAIQRNEESTPGLDNGRFVTLTTITGRPGFYITGPGRLMAPPGSDFTFWPYGRVMDLISILSRQALLNFLNSNVRVNKDGTILEKDAVNIELFVDNFVRQGARGQISDLIVSISRTNNVLQTQAIWPSIRAIPLGFALFINADLGFTNNALQIRAA